MIAAIKGKIFDISPGLVLVDTGKGFIVKVLVPISSYSQIKNNDEVFLHTVLRQKEEEIVIYGFLSKKEKLFFEKLIAISGVGGKIALVLISAFTSDELFQAIENGDVAKLSSIPGIGKKTAQRIILELMGKVDFDRIQIDDELLKLKEDLISALVNLGYSTKGVKDLVNKMITEHPEEKSFENLFKLILKKISRNRQ